MQSEIFVIALLGECNYFFLVKKSLSHVVVRTNNGSRGVELNTFAIDISGKMFLRNHCPMMIRSMLLLLLLLLLLLMLFVVVVVNVVVVLLLWLLMLWLLACCCC